MMDEQATSGRGFDPGRYLTRVSGADYLEVKWRLVWFREEFPQGRIETELIHYDEQRAMFKATVTAIRDGEILGVATGHGDETTGDFRDHAMKAETKAIGRALAALGFGTQFTYDFADAGDGRLADAPVSPPGTPPANVRSLRTPPPSETRSSGVGTSGATTKQLEFIRNLARDMDMSELMLDDLAQVTAGTAVADLTRKGASQLIEELQRRKANGGPLASASSIQEDTRGIQSAESAAVAAARASAEEGNQAAEFAASANWTSEQQPWVSRILRASDGRALDGIAAAMPRDRAGHPDQQLTDLVALRRAEVPA